MKLDLIEINKLSPPGLWDLGVLAAAISMLRSVISAKMDFGSALIYGRMVVRYGESLREKTRDNLNMRIKAWVMQCPSRIAFVRRSIGEAAIRHWRTNRLLGYAFTKYFGNWKRKFPNGFGNTGMHPTRKPEPKITSRSRAYTWKVFALVKILNVHGFLYRKPRPNQQDHEMRDAYLRLWGVDIFEHAGLGTWAQPRQPRTHKPIRFTPDELEPEEKTKTSCAISTAHRLSVKDAPQRIETSINSGVKSDIPPPDKKPP